MGLTAEQHDALLRPIRPHRVLQANGQAHVPAYDVAAHLTRVFGFTGWEKRILTLNLVCEDTTTTSGGKPAWEVTYSCTLRLTVKDRNGNELGSWDDGACGSSKQPQRGEAHDMALKSAISYALKRCAAFGLGDQFGLSLYNKGSTAPLVGKSLVAPDWRPPEGEAPDLEAHIQPPLSLGNDERDDSTDEGRAAETVRAAPARRSARVPNVPDDGAPFE